MGTGIAITSTEIKQILRSIDIERKPGRRDDLNRGD